MRPAHVTGLSLWTPGYGSLAAWARGEEDVSCTDCSCAWVPPRLLRGASRFTRMLGEAAEQATRDAGGDPRTIATVYGSDYGEIETMIVLLDTIFRGDGQLSPMRFKNSVHNAASGLCSIGQANQSFSTALAAGTRTFEASMLEALALLDERGGSVVVSIAGLLYALFGMLRLGVWLDAGLLAASVAMLVAALAPRLRRGSRRETAAAW